jgi:hypothetical protein
MEAVALFQLVTGLVVVVFLALVIISRRARRHGGSYRASVVGALYEMHNKEKQRALDVLVEGRAAETRPDHPDDTVPDPEPEDR